MSQTVTVACKLPNGLELELRDEDGERQVHLVRGSAARRRLEVGGEVVGDVGSVAFGYGLTQVPKDFWEEWLKRNAKYQPVVSQAIFALPDVNSAKSKAREMEKIETGLEPINPEGDKRVSSKKKD